MSPPRIYVASLTDYNNGELHGTWLDAVDIDDVWEGVKAMLEASPYNARPELLIYGPAEEWAIHDHEGFGSWRLGESESFERVCRVGAFIQEHGEAAEKFIGLIDDAELDEDLEERFTAAYRGEWDSEEDYRAEQCNELVLDQFRAALGEVRSHGTFGPTLKTMFEESIEPLIDESRYEVDASFEVGSSGKLHVFERGGW